MSSLLVTHGHHFGVRHELLDRTSLGRSSNCTIQLLDEKASRVHASIVRDGTGFVLRDEGSSNGTGLNGRLLLAPKRLEAGDEIAIGNNLMLFEPDLEILTDLEGAGAVILAPVAGGSVPSRLLPPTGNHAPSHRIGGLLAEIANMFGGPRGRGHPAALVESVTRGLMADRGAFLLAPSGGEPMKAVATHPHRSRVTIQREFLHHVLETGSAALVDQGVADLAVQGGRSLIETRGGSALAVPIARGGRVRGVYYADATSSDEFREFPIELLQSVLSIAFSSLLTSDPRALRPAPHNDPGRRPIARSQPARHMFEDLRSLAESAGPVLFSGETGTGKEFLARYLHGLGPRAEGPFLTVKCGSLGERAAEVLLFGKEGHRDAPLERGLVERADGGCLLLDEVEALSLGQQVKVLRLLQEGRFYRTNGTRPVRVDVRLLAGTHHDLEHLVRRGVFSKDLRDRLEAGRLQVPSLRDRVADIGTFVRTFTREFNDRTGETMEGFTAEAVGLLEATTWPMNVRELREFVERVLIVAVNPTVEASEVRTELDARPSPRLDTDGSDARDSATSQRRVTARALARTDGNPARAAAMLGISRAELTRRIIQYRIDDRGR